jgi:hypothetical protein
MPTSSATTSGPNRAGPSSSLHIVRATSPAKSRLIIRLPDLSSPKATMAVAATVVDSGPSTELSNREMSKVGAATSSGSDMATVPVAWRRSIAALPQKALALVRQPKFWLACVVAIVVQVVLAMVITPAEEDLDRTDRPLTALKPWPKAPEAPPARIVVPAAPANVADESSESMPGATTPMGPTAPLEPATETASPGGQPFSAEGPGDLLSPTRMADNRSRADETIHFDGRTPSESDGATLGGISPLEPAPEQNTREQR